MAFVAMSALAVMATLSGQTALASVCLVCCGALAAFLFFNIPARFNRKFR